MIGDSKGGYFLAWVCMRKHVSQMAAREASCDCDVIARDEDKARMKVAEPRSCSNLSHVESSFGFRLRYPQASFVAEFPLGFKKPNFLSLCVCSTVL